VAFRAVRADGRCLLSRGDPTLERLPAGFLFFVLADPIRGARNLPRGLEVTRIGFDTCFPDVQSLPRTRQIGASLVQGLRIQISREQRRHEQQDDERPH
jgi:hypothetical protein